MFSFRVPFYVISGRLHSTAEYLELLAQGDERIWIQTTGRLDHSDRLSLRGSGFATDKAALERARHVCYAIRLAFLRSGVVADFLERRPMGTLTDEGLRLVGQSLQPGVRVINETPGILVYPTGDQVIAFGGSASGIALTPTAHLVEQFVIADEEVLQRDSAMLAFDVYSGAARMPTPDATLLTLVSAIETLVSPRQIEAAGLSVIDQLVAVVNSSESDLDVEARAALASRVRMLKTESIRRACRRLSRRIAGRAFAGMPPERFIDHVYGIRSRLSHGDNPPSHSEVMDVVPELRRFVRTLIELEFTSSITS